MSATLASVSAGAIQVEADGDRVRRGSSVHQQPGPAGQHEAGPGCRQGRLPKLRLGWPNLWAAARPFAA